MSTDISLLSRCILIICPLISVRTSHPRQLVSFAVHDISWNGEIYAYFHALRPRLFETASGHIRAVEWPPASELAAIVGVNIPLARRSKCPMPCIAHSTIFVLHVVTHQFLLTAPHSTCTFHD